ncbi:uncharacterized protein FPRO_10218 [Fusarium proliferatum ET1]|uniref:Uncharacterized protein n=1 Tax=Fusarium proliferatum (strain ET1) TaxID=1227346 RepID=A0A1L7VJ83_FUSPR|nr:uncharacterized protein FPRO_10218 [Fusarium proliferatum ET1]CZR40628.1 uncharacterized protein FPRO_10218 [Fusarium proliferatum ET1]
MSKKMEPQKSTLRHITIFTVPAGTPVPISGPAYLGRYIKASSIPHWGTYVETEQDVQTRQGLCVELGRSSDGGIIVLHRTRQRREETESQAGIKYEKTGKFTSWDNDSIVRCDFLACGYWPNGTRTGHVWPFEQGSRVIGRTTKYEHELCRTWKTGSIPQIEPTATTGTFEVPIGMRRKVDARTKSMEGTYDSMASTSRRAYALGTNLDGYRNNKHISPSRDSKTQTPKVTREDLTDPVAMSSMVTNLVEMLKIPRSPFILKLLLDQLATDKGGPAWKEVRQKLRLALEEEIPKCKKDEKGALQNALQVLS